MQRPIVIIGSFATASFVECARLPSVGETVHARKVTRGLGGKGFNMAIQAARLGHTVQFFCTVGEDEGGTLCRTALEHNGIAGDGVIAIPGTATGHGVILRDDLGQNMIALDTGANRSFSTAQLGIAERALRTAGVVIAQLEIPYETAIAACSIAKRGGDGITILNPAPGRILDDVASAAVDVLTPNETELAICTDRTIDTEDRLREAGQILASRVRRHVVATRGSEGCVLFSGDAMEAFPTYHVDTVDSTGAGDSFNAALACGMNEGMPIREAIRFAAAAAAISVTRHETVDAYPHRNEVEAFLRAHRFPV